MTAERISPGGSLHDSPGPVLGVEALPSPPNPDLAIISYGGCLEHAVAAAQQLTEEDEIAAKVVAVEQLSPFPDEAVRHAVRGCARVVTVEEGAPGWGFGSECARCLIGHVKHFKALSGPNHPIPSSREWENDALPGSAAIRAACLELFEKD